MKITRLRTQVVHLPIDPPIVTAILGSIRSADCVLTFLDTDEGLTGEGLVFSINNRRLSVIHEMIRQLEDLVVGMDPRLGGALNARRLEGTEFPRLRGGFDRRSGRGRQRVVGPARQGRRAERRASDRRLPHRGADLCQRRPVAGRPRSTNCRSRRDRSSSAVSAR